MKARETPDAKNSLANMVRHYAGASVEARAALAAKAGVKVSVVSYILDCETMNKPSIEDVEKVLAALQLQGERIKCCFVHLLQIIYKKEIEAAALQQV